ncbi:hypothetical protein PCE1_004894 [Barthelona sp. PCE]
MEDSGSLYTIACDDPIVVAFNEGRYDMVVEHVCSSRYISFELLLAISQHDYGGIFMHNVLEKGIGASRQKSITLNRWKRSLHSFVDMKDAHPGPLYINFYEEEEEEGEEPLYQRLYFQFYNRLDEHEKSIFNVFPVFFIAHKLGFQFKQGSTDEVIDFWWDFHSLGSNIPDEHIHTFFHDTDVDWKSDFHSCKEETIYMMFKRFYRNGKVALPMLNDRDVDPSVEKYPKILDCLSRRNLTIRFGGIPLEILFFRIPSLAPKIDGFRILNHYILNGTLDEGKIAFRNCFRQPATISQDVVDMIFKEALSYLEDHEAVPSRLMRLALPVFLKLYNIKELLCSSKYFNVFWNRYPAFEQEQKEYAEFTIIWCWSHCLNFKEFHFLPRYYSEMGKVFGWLEWDYSSDFEEEEGLDDEGFVEFYNAKLVSELVKIVEERSDEPEFVHRWAKVVEYYGIKAMKDQMGQNHTFFELFHPRPSYWELYRERIEEYEQNHPGIYDEGRPLHLYHGYDRAFEWYQVFQNIFVDEVDYMTDLVHLEYLIDMVKSFESGFNNPGTHTNLAPEEYPNLGIDNLPLVVHWARAHINQREKYPDGEFNRISCVNSPNLLDKIEEKIKKRYHDPVLVYPSETQGFKTIGERTLENPQFFKIGRVEYPFVSSNCGVLLPLDWDDTRFLRTIDELIPVLNSGKYDEAQIHLFAYCIRALIAWCPKDWYMGVRTLLGRITEQHASEVLHFLYYESLSHFHSFPRLMTCASSQYEIVDHIDQLFDIRRI